MHSPATLWGRLSKIHFGEELRSLSTTQYIVVGFVALIGLFVFYEEVLVKSEGVTFVSPLDTAAKGDGNTSTATFGGGGGTYYGRDKLLRSMAFEIASLRSQMLEKLGRVESEVAQDREAEEKLMAEVKILLKQQRQEVAKQTEAVFRQEAVLEKQMDELEKGEGGASLKSNKDKDGINNYGEPGRYVRPRPLRYDLLVHGDRQEWKQGAWEPHGTFGFVQFSSYRIAANKFAMTGLAALGLREQRQLQGCRWYGADGTTIEGDLHVLFPDEHHNHQYEAAAFECDLKESTSGNGGGYVVATMDNEEMVMINEEDSPKEQDSGGDNLQYVLSSCSPPLFGYLDGRAVREWMDFHRVTVGVEHFVLYNVDGLNLLESAILKEYRDQKGFLEVIDFSGVQSYNTWSMGQAVATFDCMYRLRSTSKWILFVDLDEFLEPIAPHTMDSLLRDYKDRAWITFGSLWWGTEQCNDKEGGEKAYLERMTYHWSKHFCSEPEKYPDWKYCLEAPGHRKYILNPRKVRIAKVHEVIEPRDKGIDLSSESELLLNHFQGLNVAKTPDGKLVPKCTKAGSDDEWWIQDGHLAEVMERVWKCHVEDRECVAKLGN
eukprot:TRINITY_DN38894_c0_g1_i1.p1 TRINITY_DN38894_c0_g1~~TRINITY_DN38894_c0_g1_i1.p1  ORF type:complete len:603 (-),score=115.58 TRINITY_DN38894_c0_g1_i1:556-2364(-)